MLRKKHNDLVMACDGRVDDTYAQMCQLHVAAYDALTEQIATLDRLVEKARGVEPGLSERALVAAEATGAPMPGSWRCRPATSR